MAEVNNGVHEWFVSIEKKYSPICIPRVPEHLRRRKEIEKCFDPTVVSLGPYHYRNPNLKPSEKLKLDAVKRYTNSSINHHTNADSYFKEFRKDVAEARKCYDIPSDDIEDKEFEWIMFMDSCFVLDFIDQFVNQKGNKNKEMLRGHDLSLVARDVMLLENQVPLRLLQKLITMIKAPQSNITGGQVGATNPINNKKVEPTIKKFIMKLLRVEDSNQDHEKDAANDSKSTDDYPHLLSLYRAQFLGNPREKKETNGPPFYFRSIKELHEAGIVLKRGNDLSPKVISFSNCSFRGCLTLPQIIVDDMTKYMFLNMIAYELGRSGPRESDLISYICFMDSLIDHEEDVKFLRKKKILLNALGSDLEVAQLFNVLATDLSPDYGPYAEVMKQIEDHCKNKLYYWLNNLYYTHFHSPWTFITFVSGVFLLLLTAMQTYYSYRQVQLGQKEKATVPPTKTPHCGS